MFARKLKYIVWKSYGKLMPGWDVLNIIKNKQNILCKYITKDAKVNKALT